MSDKTIFRRACRRFEIPGAALSYSLVNSTDPPAKTDEESCPLFDISRGGVRFLARKKLKIPSHVLVKIAIPGERVPLIFKGLVRWSSLHAGKDYGYQTGIEFNSYGEDPDQNYPGTLVKLVALEHKHARSDDRDRDGEDGDFGR